MGLSGSKQESTYEVKSRTSLEPLNLALVEGVCERDLILGTIAVLYHERQVLARREGLEADRGLGSG